MGGGVSSCNTSFIGWLLHQFMQEYIRIGCVSALKKLPINSTAADLNAEKDKDILHMHPRSVDIQ